ncbi:MAG: ARMT1-like domain-containing protein [Desulfurococcales archaeon]|nr:ARMT1-like domain-containing protein [Desulfurococcales archaeon]
MPSSFKGFIHFEHCRKCLIESRSKYNVLSIEQLENMASRVDELGRTRVFVETYNMLMKKLGEDPLRDEKKKLNQEVSNIVPRDIFKNMQFRDLLPLLAIANAVDWGMVGYEYDVNDVLSGWEDTVILDMPEIDLGRIIIALDNAGEAVLDLLAGERLHELGYEVVFIARSLPYETDITLSEAEWLAGHLGIDLPIIGTGSRYPATFIEEMPDSIKGLIETADLVLAKGIANLEAAAESVPEEMQGKFYHLLRAKCIPIMELFGVPQATPLITSLRRALLYLEDYRSQGEE